MPTKFRILAILFYLTTVAAVAEQTNPSPHKASHSTQAHKTQAHKKSTAQKTSAQREKVGKRTSSVGSPHCGQNESLAGQGAAHGTRLRGLRGPEGDGAAVGAEPHSRRLCRRGGLRPASCGKRCGGAGMAGGGLRARLGPAVSAGDRRAGKGKTATPAICTITSATWRRSPTARRETAPR